MEAKTVSNYLKVPDELRVQLEWVYGIRSNDCRKALQYTVGCLAADSIGARDDYDKQIQVNNEEIVYFVASVVILLNANISRQRFYLGHEQEVISVAVSTVDGSIIASGELGTVPAIHVWSRKSLETLSVIKGMHVQGIHLLQFTNDNKFLVSCSLSNPGAVIVFDWAQSEVVISTSINSVIQEVFLLQEINQIKSDGQQPSYENMLEEEIAAIQQKPLSGIVVISTEEMIIFTVMENQFAQSNLSLDVELPEKQTLAVPLCGLAIIADYKNQYFQDLNSELAGQRHLFLTGHKDGKVLLWRSDSFIGVLTDYLDEVTCMSKCFEGIAICTWHGKIHFWDTHLTRSTKTIELQNLPFKLLSFNISSVDYNQKRLLVLTIAGDAIEIGLTAMGSSSANRIKGKKLNVVARIVGAQKGMCIVNQMEQTVVIGGDDGQVMSFDIATHELIDVWAVGNKISAIATLSMEEGGFIVVVGTQNGNLVFRQDWEEIIPKFLSCGTRTINDLNFSPNGQLLVAASSDKHVYLFQYTDGDYLKLQGIKLDNGFPIAVNFSQDSKKICVCTNTRKMLLLDPQSQTLLYRVEDLAQCFWEQWTGRYPLITKSTTSQTGLLPICIGNQSNIVAAGDENGNVLMWRDSESIKENIGVNLSGHSSAVQRVQLTSDDKTLLSLGSNDQSLFQWKVRPVEQKGQIDNILYPKKRDFKDNKVFLDDQSLVNEMNFCYYPDPNLKSTDEAPHKIEDTGLLIRGCNNQAINRLGSRLNFDPNGDEEWKRPPTVMLMLDHIYGMQTSDRRSTIIYMHFHSDKQVQPTNQTYHSASQNTTKVEQTIQKLLGSSFQREAAERPLRYEQVHSVCHKHFVYFTSRFAIIYSPFQQVQKFYQGHSLKISCLQKHPTRRLIATGEVSFEPQIHVWDAQTLEPVMILDTSHKGGILHLAFSPDGDKLISIGMDRGFSIQIFQWEQNRTLAFRNLGNYPVFGLSFYPFESSKFITCGYEHLAVWKLNGNHLQCLSFQKFESQKLSKTQERTRSVIMCMDFLNLKVGVSIASDVLFGTSQGEITTYVQGKHTCLNENAHTSAVNCLRVTDRLSDILNVITGGEDGLVKIWTITIKILQVIDVRDSIPDLLKDYKNQRCYGIQSIELYCCDKQQSRRLLLGLRCGEIIEAIITSDDHNQSRRSTSQIISSQPTVLEFQFYSFASTHSSLQNSSNLKKIQCVVNPDHPVLVSVGDDETLRIWDLERHVQIYSKHLGSMATALCYSPDGAYLAVGLVSGVFLVLDGKLDRMKTPEGQETEEFHKPSLEVLMSPKEAKSAVVAIKYSFNGDYLAVSFNNEWRESDSDPLNAADNEKKNSEMGQREPSFVMIYVNRISPKNPGLKLGSRDTYVKLLKLVLPLGDFVASVSLRQKLAVTSLDFSDCDGYLEMCVQKINHENVLDPVGYTPSEDCFVIWDIKNNSMVQNFESLGGSKWPEWSMAPAINARFQGTEINLDDGVKERELLFNELCFMSKVSRFSLLDAAICGSQQGGLYLFRFQSLTVEKSKVADFRFDFVKKREMAATRCFSGHTSLITCIENFQDKLIMTTSVTDQCIVQWKIEYEDKHWELDFNQFISNEVDPYAEFLTHEKFEKLRSEVWSQRAQVSDLKQGVYKKEFQDPACTMELQHVIGRRAFDRRQNVRFDHNDRITYQASSLQVFLSENPEAQVQKHRNTPALLESQIKQEFLSPVGAEMKSVSPELSCFCLSKDSRILFCATAELCANVYIWQTTTNTKLGEFQMDRVPVITNIKVAHDNCKVLVLGLTKEFYQVIQMVDWTRNNRVYFTRQFLHSLPYRIRDIEFMHNSTRSFITAGIQHLCFWRFSGQNLEYQVGELTIRKVMTNIGQGIYSHNPANNGRFGLSLVTTEFQQQQFLRPNARGNENIDDDYENLFVTFLNIVYVGETLITSGDDGFLYLWARERLEHRTFAHEGSIFALHANPQQNLLVSGGMEGIITLWRLNSDQKSSMKSLERLKTISLRPSDVSPQQAVMLPEYNIQSVCLGQNRIVIGTRSGSIYETQLSDTGKGMRQNTSMPSNIKQWLKCSDHETPKSVAMDMFSTRIMTITQYGLFQVWDLLTFNVVYSKSYAKKTKFIQSFRLSNKVMIVFEHEITVLDSDPKSNNFDEKNDYSLNLNSITHATLNHNEQILGVATISTAGLPDITLYSTDKGFMKLKQIFGFKAAIRFLDFSTDNYYLQVEDTVGEVTLYEIETDRPIQTDAIDFELEWLGEGLRTYARLKGVRHQYNSNNKISKIKKLLGKPIVVIADELGTIRLFNYPNVKGEPYYQCYADHLYKISDCVFSPDRLFFVSSCEMDRCIFKWKMHFNETKLHKMISEDIRKLNEISQAEKLNREQTFKKQHTSAKQ